MFRLKLRSDVLCSLPFLYKSHGELFPSSFVFFSFFFLLCHDTRAVEIRMVQEMKEEKDGEFIYIDWEDKIFSKNPCRCTVNEKTRVHISTWR